MPLHEDAVDREGNLTDEEYEAARLVRIEALGGENPDPIPEAVLEAAYERAEEFT